jgi:hypothetical protein
MGSIRRSTIFVVVAGDNWARRGVPAARTIASGIDRACDVVVELLFPAVSGRLELGSSGWPGVAGVDAVGGPPYGDVGDEPGIRTAARGSPDGFGDVAACLVSDMGDEVGDELGSSGQVLTPFGITAKCGGNVGEPGKRPWLGLVNAVSRQ